MWALLRCALCCSPPVLLEGPDARYHGAALPPPHAYASQQLHRPGLISSHLLPPAPLPHLPAGLPWAAVLSWRWPATFGCAAATRSLPSLRHV